MDDVVIVGGGIIGTATAYFLSKEGRKVKVIERDPTYKTASFPLSLGGFRRQFFQKENILLGKFAREFIFQIPELLKTEKNPNPTASMVTNGYLLMFGPEHAEEQYEALKNHEACEAGTKNIKGSELSKIFPYINSEGIETATYTDNQSEGWIDPFMFHGALKGKAIELGAEFIFSTVQTISKPENLELFNKEHFDYIVIDETHRAGAESYKRVLEYFKPGFLLGMTATPERTDGENIFKHFDYNIAYEIRLHRALEEEMLSPFHYYGVTDISVNGQIIDDNAAFDSLTSNERVDKIIEKYKALEEINDFMLVEGTDFSGEGTAIELDANILIFLSE